MGQLRAGVVSIRPSHHLFLFYCTMDLAPQPAAGVRLGFVPGRRYCSSVSGDGEQSSHAISKFGDGG